MLDVMFMTYLYDDREIGEEIGRKMKMDKDVVMFWRSNQMLLRG